MIHMLSRFDLKPDVNLAEFEKDYASFFEHVRALGMAETTGRIGKRIADTPMDTDAEDAQQFYVVMTFENREQLDQAYEFFLTGARKSPQWTTHQKVNTSIINPVFTCWQDDT